MNNSFYIGGGHHKLPYEKETLKKVYVVLILLHPSLRKQYLKAVTNLYQLQKA